jgi:hypothetical protein
MLKKRGNMLAKALAAIIAVIVISSGIASHAIDAAEADGYLLDEVVEIFNEYPEGAAGEPSELSDKEGVEGHAADITMHIRKGFVIDQNAEHITIGDALLALQGALGVVELTEAQRLAVTLDGDELTVEHATRIMRYALGLSSEL